MSTAIAVPSPASMAVHDRHSPRYAPLAPAVPHMNNTNYNSSVVNHEARPPVISVERSPPNRASSPQASRVNSNPKIVVKKEPPSSPSNGQSQQNGRHRPRKLDLNTTTNIPAPLSSRPSAGASMHDMGLMCLSPGFQTHDPSMREQLQRSISVRDQQRSIIEARLLKTATKGEHPEPPRLAENSHSFGQPPPLNLKKRPPPGLSIVPPAAERFANERVIQSAPLGQTFTGRNSAHPAMREQPSSNLAPHIQHVPATQTNNRLPPISDVFGNNTLQPMTQRPPFQHTNSTPSAPHGPPLPSPGFPPQTAHPMSQPPHPFERPRDFRSAEEAVQEMTRGREDLQPKIIRYSGRQPPTPPSPNQRYGDRLTPNKYHQSASNLGGPDSGAGRRRTRNEYEADSSPPLGTGPDRDVRDRIAKLGPFGQGRDSPATQQAKKDEFMTLVSKAWDLFHS